jgi:hypothetical protein
MPLGLMEVVELEGSQVGGVFGVLVPSSTITIILIEEGDPSLEEIYQIFTHVSVSCFLGGGIIYRMGLVGELGGFRGKSSDCMHMDTMCGDGGENSCYREGMMGLPLGDNARFYKFDVRRDVRSF